MTKRNKLRICDILTHVLMIATGLYAIWLALTGHRWIAIAVLTVSGAIALAGLQVYFRIWCEEPIEDRQKEEGR